MDEIPGIILLDSTLYLLTQPNQFSGVHVALMDSVYYELLLDDRSRIKYISTSDSNFTTVECLKIGDTFSLLQKKVRVKKKNIGMYRGWGYALELKSGWFAVFDFRKPVQEDSPIQFFFQRSD